MIRKQCLNCLQVYSAEESVCKEDGNALSAILVEDLAGSVISGRYKIVKEIGRGGMGVVYEATQLGLDRKVALKMLLADLSNLNQEDIGWKRFEIEAKAASSLNHPNIIKIYEYAVSEFGLPYIVMDYVDGVSLEDVLDREKQLNIKRTLSLFISISNALSHAHKRNIIHRDLKPSNIMLISDDGDGEKIDEMPLILDFGIAKIFTQSGKAALNLTKTGEVFGSPLYMSPEQCMGQPLDPRSDIYSLGCILYQALSGTTPIGGNNFLNVLFNHMNSRPMPLDSVSLKIPGHLEEIIYRCLSKAPADRFETMAQLKSALSQSLSLHNELEAVNKMVPGEPTQDQPKKTAKKDKQSDIENLDKTIDVTSQNKQKSESKSKSESDSKSKKSAYIERLEKAAKSGDNEAQYDLAWAYELGEETDVDLHMAFHWFKEAAENGHLQALHKTGYMLEKGIGTAMNEKRAFQWYKKAADAGVIHGERDLGYCYQYGVGVDADLDMAFYWTQKAAQNDDTTALCALGGMYRNGLVGDGKPDQQKAFDCYLRAAVQNEPYSQHQLALMQLYEDDFRDDERGMMWLEQAAESGVPAAQYDLAMFYKRGDIVKIDKEKYLNWMIAAADQNFNEAILELANYYFMRRREGKNFSKALKWLKLASSFGNEQALTRYKQCKKESPDLGNNPD